jgi:hypothetical protein
MGRRQCRRNDTGDRPPRSEDGHDRAAFRVLKCTTACLAAAKSRQFGFECLMRLSSRPAAGSQEQKSPEGGPSVSALRARSPSFDQAGTVRAALSWMPEDPNGNPLGTAMNG